MQPLISIIVPVYNVELYLEKCVNSIFAQTYENLEIILIDDGSPDNSPHICDDLALKDKRVKVYHKVNGGASSARNYGLNVAKGEYICFVDSDDVLPTNCVMDLYKGISSNECQYAAGVCTIKSNGDSINNNGKSDIVIDFNANPMQLLNYITRSGSYSPYAKIFKASIINENKIRYNENLKCSEDALFIRQYLRFCSRVVLIPEVVYFYNDNNVNSLSKKGYPDFYLYYIEKLYALKELVAILPISETQRNNFLSDRAVHGLYISIQHYFFNWNDKKTIKELMQKSISAFIEWININRENPKVLPKTIKWWKKYHQLINDNQVDVLYRKLYYNYRFRINIRKIKLMCKRMISK